MRRVATGDERWFEVALDQARAGVPAGFDALVRHLHGRLIGFCRARGADDPEALADDVLVAMCRSIDSFDGGLAQFRAWVFTIARNRLVDERRRAGRRVDSRPTEPSDVTELAGAVDVDVGVDVDAFDERARIDALLSGLTDEQREVVVLRIVVGLSVEEVAAVVGRRPGAVRALQHRALRQLRASLVGEE